MELETEKRLERLERLIAGQHLLQEDQFDAFERKSFKCAKVILWMFGLASMVLVGVVELMVLVHLLLKALSK